MGNFMSDLTKALFISKKESNKNVSSIGNTIITQSRCPECRYNSEEYDIDEYCAECDGQSMFIPREQEDVQEESAYERVLALIAEMTAEEKRTLVQTLKNELSEQEE